MNPWGANTSLSGENMLHVMRRSFFMAPTSSSNLSAETCWERQAVQKHTDIGKLNGETQNPSAEAERSDRTMERLRLYLKPTLDLL